MTNAQRLAVRLSEVRERLNAIASMDNPAEDVLSESNELRRELVAKESQWRAAIAAENAIEDSVRAASEVRDAPAADSEAREVSALRDRAMLGSYIRSAIDGRAVDGAEAELAAARGCVGRVPWDAFAQRADVPTPSPSSGNPVNQDPILARVFARSATAFLGIDMPSVATGTASYPVLTSAPAAEFKAKDALEESVAGVITANTVEPTRLTARVSFRVEDVATTAGLEDALRMDLGSAMQDELDKQILVGDGTSPNLAGLFDDGSGITVPSNATTEADFAAYNAIVADSVDGIYAASEGDVSVLFGVATLRHARRAIATGTAISGLDRVMGVAAGFMSSAHVADVASKNQSAMLRRGTLRAAVAPVWQGVQLIRDELSDAGKGWVHVTAVALYGFEVVRAAAFNHVKLQIQT